MGVPRHGTQRRTQHHSHGILSQMHKNKETSDKPKSKNILSRSVLFKKVKIIKNNRRLRKRFLLDRPRDVKLDAGNDLDWVLVL